VSVDDARKRSKEWALALLEGSTLAKPGAGTTLKDLADRYEKWNRTRGLRHPTWLSDLMTAGCSDWLARPLESLTRADLADRYADIASKRGMVAAGRTVKALRTLYTYAEAQDLYAGKNVAKGVKVTEPKPRRRYLNDEELAKVRTALESPTLAEWAKPYFNLLLLTGARRSNVAGMRWADLDLSAGKWRVPAEDSKNKEALELVLVPEAVRVLTERRASITSPWVFPTTHKHSATGHLTEPWYAWQDVLKLASVEGVTVHDCRRTVGVRLTSSGAPISVVAKVLGHSSIGATARSYAWASPEAAREWLERLT